MLEINVIRWDQETNVLQKERETTTEPAVFDTHYACFLCMCANGL